MMDLIQSADMLWQAMVGWGMVWRGSVRYGMARHGMGRGFGLVMPK